MQRVSIIRCLVSNSDLILADEPTGQLDGANSKTVAAGLARAAREGKIVILATHDLDVAALADQVIDLRTAAS